MGTTTKARDNEREKFEQEKATHEMIKAALREMTKSRDDQVTR